MVKDCLAVCCYFSVSSCYLSKTLTETSVFENLKPFVYDTTVLFNFCKISDQINVSTYNKMFIWLKLNVNDLPKLNTLHVESLSICDSQVLIFDEIFFHECAFTFDGCSYKKAGVLEPGLIEGFNLVDKKTLRKVLCF